MCGFKNPFYLFLMLNLIGCSKSIDKLAFIEKYGDEKFDEFIDTAIHYRKPK
ncbi:hypothetical protein C900_04248 [Fulvivirga imtechensis AK7]|uniref:Uncharacterized protein n=1 Tax=Fulvivirga imtechensis AK7 TaxID=1237149 RepID=L8JWH2_9BACT|nr:hypothetical protein C900_04248 [Fulvivirga imtechensis AK7]